VRNISYLSYEIFLKKSNLFFFLSITSEMKTRKLIFLLTIMQVLLTFTRVTVGQIERGILPANSLQLVVVTTPNLNASAGIIQLFERENAGASWHLVAKPETVVIGRKGLAWSQNTQRVLGDKKPLKKEGDKKTPAGFFYLSAVFGDASASRMGDLKMPYLRATNTLVCVDDVNSTYYNQIVDSSSIAKKDWKSHENMKRNDNLYRLGVVIDYNMFPTIKGNGSCIFLHIWRSSHSPTIGCTAMAPKVMKKLVSWLELEKKPILVQLPQTEFEKINQNWCLSTKFNKNQSDCQGEVIKDSENSNTLPGLYPEASTRRLTHDDLLSLSKWQLKIMKNEIFARHGYIFKSAVMKNYFQAKPWYRQQFHNVYHLLTSIERKNIKLIKQYDK
jgi:L,D-peptidoglycan transpeptidase YkuD (ErfK/YbiS/YcfS/YnhG family)